MRLLVKRLSGWVFGRSLFVSHNDLEFSINAMMLVPAA